MRRTTGEFGCEGKTNALKPIMPPHHPYFAGWSESNLKVVTITHNQDQLHISKPLDAASTGNSSWMAMYVAVALRFIEYEHRIQGVSIGSI